MRYSFGDFILDGETGELLRAGEVVVLRRQTFRLLQLLVERAPALLEHDTLLDEVWGRTALSANAVPQAISELRRALGDDAQSPQYIETRHRRGYRFLATVRTETTALADAELPTSVASPTDVSPVARPLRLGRWRFAVGTIAGALVLLMLGLWIIASTHHDRAAELSMQSTSLALAALPADGNVVAWVPPAALELFGQRLADSQVRLLRSDALGLASGPQDARWQHRAHDLLGANYALGGRWHGEKNATLTLDFSLIDLDTGRLVTSKRINGKISDLDALIAEASATISTSLRLAPAKEHEVQTRPPAAERKAYWSALANLDAGHAAVAASDLARLHTQLGKPAWIEPALIDAQVKSGEREAALKILDARLAQHQPLPLGQRLRLQATAASLRHQPADAAAALRALIELYPDDVESWISLVESELDALQGNAARATLKKLEVLPAVRNDPRLGLLRSRLARLDNNFALAQREAIAALHKATEYDLPDMAIVAAIAQSDALRGEGKLDDGARLLAATDASWSARANRATLLELRLRQIQLLREQGRTAEAHGILAHVHDDFADPQSRARIGIEQAQLDISANLGDDAEAVLQAIKPYIDENADPDLSIGWLNADALAAIARNDADHAQRSFASAFALARSSGRAGQSVSLQVNAGLALMRQRRFTEADQQWQQALETFESLGDRRGQATCLGNLAASASTQGKPERSVELNSRALALFRELHLSGPQARTAYNLALSAERDGKLDLARTYYLEAGDAWTAGGQHDLALRAAVGQAQIALLSNDIQAAKRILDGVPHGKDTSAISRSHVLAMQARVALVQGDLPAARHLNEQSLALRQRDGNQGWIALSELELLRIDLLDGRDAAQVQIQAESLAQRFSSLHETRDEARAWLLVADAQLTRGKIDGARRSLDKVKAASHSFSDRTVSFDLEWAQAWLGDDDERSLRLQSLQVTATKQGYLLQARRVEQALAVLASATEPNATSMLPMLPYVRASADNRSK